MLNMVLARVPSAVRWLRPGARGLMLPPMLRGARRVAAKQPYAQCSRARVSRYAPDSLLGNAGQRRGLFTFVKAQTATAHVQLHGDRRAGSKSKPAPQVGGFYLANIPAWIAWLKYLSFVYFGYNLLLKAEFRGRTLWDCGGGNPPHPSAQAGCTAVPPGGLQAKLHLQARPRGPTPVGLWRMRVLSRARPRHAVATGWRALARTFAARRSTGAHAPCAVVCKSWGCSSASCQSIYDLLREEGPNLTGLLP